MTQYLILGLVEYPEAGDVDDQIVLGHIIIIISQVSDPLQASLQELGDVEAEGGQEGGQEVGGESGAGAVCKFYHYNGLTVLTTINCS